MKRNSEKILEEQGKSVPFSICFERLLNDLMDAADLLKEYLLLEYNKKAQKSHIGKLITAASAGEVVKQAFENCLESDLF